MRQQPRLRAWAEQYLDEMSSEPGCNIMRDVQCSPTMGYYVTLFGRQLQMTVDRYPDSTLHIPKCVGLPAKAVGQ